MTDEKLPLATAANGKRFRKSIYLDSKTITLLEMWANDIGTSFSELVHEILLEYIYGR